MRLSISCIQYRRVKMKYKFSLLRFLLMVIVASLLLAACMPTVAGFVELPDNLKASITGLVIALVGLLFDFVIGILPTWIGVFLRQYQEAWAIALSAAFVTWLQNFLPSGFEDLSIKGVAFLLALVFVFVPYIVARKAFVKRRVRGFVSG